MRRLLSILFLPTLAMAQAPLLTVQPVYPTSGPDTRSRVEYSIVPAKGVSAAWIEVWDRPKLLMRTSVDVSEHGQILMPDYEKVDNPDALRIAVYDPQAPLSNIDSFEGPAVVHGDTVSETVIGVGEPRYWETPDVYGAVAQRVVAGADKTELIVMGHGFSSKTQVLLVDERFEYTQSGHDGRFAHTVRDTLNTQFVDMCRLRVKLPSGDLLRPAHLQLYVTNEIAEDDLEHNGTSLGDRAESLYVAGPDSPVIEKVGPVVPGKSAEERTITLWGKNFAPRLVVHLGRDPDSSGSWRLDTEVVSATELRVRFEHDLTHANLLWVADDDDETRVSEPAEFHPAPSASHQLNPQAAIICSVDPYPFEMLQPNSPKFLPLRVRGYHFRPDDKVVVVKNEYSKYDIRLKTKFVSAEELLAWFPRDLWRVHKITFRLVVRTGGKYYDTEISSTD
jgi:hypothetical protein